MSIKGSINEFYWDQGTDPVISVEAHSYTEEEGEEEVRFENARIKFNYAEPHTEIEISMPMQDLKKLVIAATRFLKDGQATMFQKFHWGDGKITDNFKVGDIGNQIEFPTEKILKRYSF